MFKKMTVPLDGSTLAEQILPYARLFAERLKLPVEFVGVVEVEALTSHVSPEIGRYLDTLLAEGMKNGEEYLAKIARSFTGLNVRTIVARGEPAEVIIERAAADKNTLVAMATHGRSGLNRWLLGSIAEKVLRGSANPMLLARAARQAKMEGEAALKVILVPLDGSELAETVLPKVVELAITLGLEVVLVRAYQTPYTAYATAYAISYEELTAEARNEALRYLEKKAEALKKQGLEKVSFVAPEGIAAEEIISLGRKNPESLIAMCSHGRSGVQRWVLGSVAERVVRHCGDPVLVLRAA
jgi:nucleotide-binding universal stress UspA family protein